MHKLAKKMAECLKAKVEGIGIDNIEGERLVELGMWVDIIKDIACYDKDMRIIEAMDEAEEEEDDEEKRYYPRRRDSRGRFMSNRGRGRVGYEEPPYMHIPEPMWDEMRDMDYGMGRMYYPDNRSSQGSGVRNTGNTGNTGRGMNSQNYGSQTSRYGYSYDNYMEERKNYSKSDPAHKQERVRMMDEYTKDLTESITKVMEDVSPEEKVMLKTKLSKLVSTMG